MEGLCGRILYALSAICAWAILAIHSPAYRLDGSDPLPQHQQILPRHDRLGLGLGADGGVECLEALGDVGFGHVLEDGDGARVQALGVGGEAGGDAGLDEVERQGGQADLGEQGGGLGLLGATVGNSFSSMARAAGNQACQT